jgi:hypothetical protein
MPAALFIRGHHKKEGALTALLDPGWMAAVPLKSNDYVIVDDNLMVDLNE